MATSLISTDRDPDRRSQAPDKPRRPKPGKWWWAGLAVLIGLVALALVSIPVVSRLAQVSLVIGVLTVLAVVLMMVWRRLLWRVGRRLTFSYLLIGVLPIPLLAILLGVGGYLLSGFFLAHLFRSSMSVVYSELVTTASISAAAFAGQSNQVDSPFEDFDLIFYKDGKRLGSNSAGPEAWPAWLAQETEYALETESRSVMPPLLATADGGITIGAAVSLGPKGVLAIYRGDLADALGRRSQVWVELVRANDERKTVATLQVFDSEWTLMPLSRTGSATNHNDFFREQGQEPKWMIVGLEAAGPLFDVASGTEVDDGVSATVFAPFSTVIDNLFSRSSEVDAIAWIAFILPAFLLFDIYLIALIMAAYLIFGLSRAVNQLSRATAAVSHSDFSHRIKVRRQDQVGDLQRAFNDMGAHLETSVHRAAEQEVIAKELEIAQDLQQGLLPTVVDTGAALDVACFFEPSTVIGGDYYDILRLPDERPRIAIVNADVSGHGLPAGLRMAMLKSALDILVRERKDLEEILAALDHTVRTSGDRRSFVTAVLCVLDLQLGTVEITNAGAPPTYLLRQGEVEEIVLAGSPLGALGNDYEHRSVRLERGDVLVWLSDGLIEATNDDDDAFGYDGILETLAGPADSASEVRDRLINAVRLHCAGRPADDDRTMVVVRYLGPPSAESQPIRIG